MGVVYLAEQTGVESRKVALKVVRPGMNTRDVLGRFEAERQALAEMDDPNIATVLDTGESRSGLPYFVVEYVPGVPITEYCDQHTLTVRQRLALFVPVCRAVEHAHRKGLIHGGLKPSSVLVAADDAPPRPTIIDFGIARATERWLTRAIVQTGPGPLPGTPAYLSPEQAELTGLDLDRRTDVYSLGVMLYELLAGVLPFREEELSGLSALYAVLETEPPTLSKRFADLGDQRTGIAARRNTELAELTRHLNGDLEAILRKAMAKDRSRRYETAGDLALDLQRYLTGQPVSARPRSAGYRMRKFVRRHRTAFVVGVAAVVVGVIAVVRFLF